MNLPSVPYGIQTLAGIVDWLRTLAVSIAAGWNVEHTSTGTHGAVTATSVTTESVAADAMTIGSLSVATREEGAWTPALAFGGGSTGLTYSSRAGVYSKVGAQVTVTCYVALSAKGSSTGAASITGLPFTSASGAGTNVNSGVFGYATNLASLTSPVTLIVGSGATTVLPYDWGAAGIVALDDTNFGNTSDFGFTLSYQASA